MSVFDTPWMSSMSKASTLPSSTDPSNPQQAWDPNPPTFAAFSPTSSSGYSATSKQRSTIIVHKKSPLLVATPPQITRALAHSHPFLLPLNKLVGLLSWSTQDPWESYLLVALFWAVTLYGSEVIRFASPVLIVLTLILGMYSRRYSPLSSTTKTGDKRPSRGDRPESSGSSTSNHKTLDEIVDTLQEFTARCNILLGPFLNLTDFLSTQTTPTAATTRPALTTLFIRVILVTPVWILLTLPPFYILTPRRVLLAVGTIVLTWHSRPARVSRVILWRSVLVRKSAAFVTGLNLDTSSKLHPDSSLRPGLGPRNASQTGLALEIATKKRPDSSGVRFTFILYENQRRWLGLGWTTSLFAYERGPWSDEHLNPAPSKDEFELPSVEGGQARWRWVEGSAWKVERGDSKKHKRAASQIKTGATGTAGKDADGDGGGWIYYDNKWTDGGRDDAWGKYTRRRKWYRDAELVEATPSVDPTPSGTPTQPLSDTEEDKVKKAKAFAQGVGTSNKSATSEASAGDKAPAEGTKTVEDGSSQAKPKKAAWFKANRDRSDSKSSSGKNTAQFSNTSQRSRDGPEDDVLDQWRENSERHRAFSVQEDVAMNMG